MCTLVRVHVSPSVRHQIVKPRQPPECRRASPSLSPTAESQEHSYSTGMSGQSARTLGRLLAERAKAAGAAYGGGGGGGGRPGGAGGGAPPNLGRIIGGSGAAIALVVGGLVINSALFNGGCCVSGVDAGAAVDASSSAGFSDASTAQSSRLDERPAGTDGHRC